VADFGTFIATYQHKNVVEYPNRVLETVPNPRVSCWIVAYNQVRYVRQAIDSVLAQQVDFPIEIIIGDDDSNDGTREILIEYAEKHPDVIRLFLHCRENNIPIHGGTPNPNFQGIYNWSQCRGEYIATLECDDYWTDPLKLAKQARFLDEHLAHMGVCANFSVVDTDGKTVKERKYTSIQYPDYRFQYALRFHTISRTLTCMYRNDAEVTQLLYGLAQAPFLDRIILALMTERGPMYSLSDVMASFRSGSGFFTPHRELIGKQQLVNQWEQLSRHYKQTPFERTSVAVLHHARSKRDAKSGKFERFTYFLRQLNPSTREPHFSFGWYAAFRYLDPVSIPMSYYALNKSRVPEGFHASFDFRTKSSVGLETLKSDVLESSLDAFEVQLPYSFRLFLYGLKQLPDLLFQCGYRLVDIRIGDQTTYTHAIRFLFVREGSPIELSFYT
jgi:glycosyltransferase involved in cell wall biosynthesis